MRNAALTATVAMTALVTACGHTSQDAAAAHAQHSGKGQVDKSAKVPGMDPDMVSAVSLAGPSTTPISMKFKLGSRPVVTTPLQVSVLVIPASGTDITHIRVSFQPGDGLLLQSDRSLDVTDLSAGTPIQQDVTVVPQQSGVLSLSATVLVDTDTGSITRTYSIPLVAADNHS